jgi:hypothetical protein
VSDSGTSRILQNAVTVVGAVLTTVSAVVFLTFFFLDLFGYHTNPYIGILLFLILPALFIVGLLLIPIGLMRERRRVKAGLGPSIARWPRIDLNQSRTRTAVFAIALLTGVNILIVSLAAMRGVEYMDSVGFCGQVCHTVMEPEFVAYQDGPHSRVPCVECHIGPGAPWFVKAKIDGVRQVVAVALNTYSRPIASPVRDLRPARDTCEHCHWPEKFTGDLIRQIPSYASDEPNTPAPTVVRLKVGGGGWRHGGPQGIHWHTSASNRIEYVAADERRETIPYVRLTDATGKVTEFVAKGFDRSRIDAAAMRTMDCVDCHNRPSHRFASTAERAVDAALAVGQVPADLPYVRREAVRLLQQGYPDAATAERTIADELGAFYKANYPAAAAPAVARAIQGVQRAYTHNVFPVMRLTWGTHPNHVGHTDSPGCFRCHDEEHAAADGRTIRQDCELCHTVEMP